MNNPTVDDLVLENGRIHTMDASNTIVSTVAIRDGRFIGDGGAFTARPRTRSIVDLRGRTVVPGIIDNHNHIVLMGNRPGYHTPLENAYSIADVQADLRGPGAPGLAGRRVDHHHRRLPLEPFSPEHARLPTLAELDAAVPNNPVYLIDGVHRAGGDEQPGKAFFETQAPPTGRRGRLDRPAGRRRGRATLALRQTLLDSGASASAARWTRWPTGSASA